jgi:acyl-CoA synthetase (NDP forming)
VTDIATNPEPAHLARPERLAKFFAPRSIAIVGATENSFWSRNAIQNLKILGFDGELVLVNPRRKVAFELPCIESLRHLEKPVDLAYIVAPTSAVAAVIDDAGEAGVHNAVVVGAGFSELGGHGGDLQQALVEQAQRHGICLLGPNCPGFLNTSERVAAYGQAIPVGLAHGAVSVVLQSGALASAVLKFSQAYGIGLSTVVCMGNEAVIRAADVLEHLIADPATRVIAMFLEQIRDGARFLRLAKLALALGKPIVVLKVGRTPEGQRTALAHTGAIAGDEKVIDAALKQVGVIRVRSLEELLMTAGLLAQGPKLKGPRMAVVTSSGGACDIIADRAADEGLIMPKFSLDTATKLADYLPDFATVQNPLDGAAVDTMRNTGTAAVPMDVVAETVSQDPNFDFLLYMGFNTVPLDRPAAPEDQAIARRLAYVGNMVANSAVPFVAMSQTCLGVGSFAREHYEKNGIFMLGGIEFGMTAIGHAVRWEATRVKVQSDVQNDPVSRLGSSPLVRRRGPWSEADGRDLLLQAGVPVVPAVLVQSAEEAVVAAGKIGFPVVLKICASEIAHKSDIGGVALKLNGPLEVTTAYERIIAAAKKVPTANVEGVLVSPMRPTGIELFAGITVDPTFGPVLAVGLGGVWIEIFNDVSLRILPVTKDGIAGMLEGLKAKAILDGARGGPKVNIEAAADVIWRLSQVAIALGDDLHALEVNPIWCLGDQVEALDILVILKHE